MEYRHLSEETLGDMIAVVALSRAGLPYERRLTHKEAMAFTFRDPDFDPRGTWLVALDDQAIGFGSASVDSNRISAGKDDGRLDVDVIPAHRGKGIEWELLNRSLGYLRSRGVAIALSRCYLDDEWKMSFLISNSFVEYYRVYDLVRKGRTEVPLAKLPEWFSLERKLFADHSDDEVVAFVEAFNESFLDHLNFAPELPERFINWRDGLSDPMLITTARKDDMIVGVCASEESSLFNKEHGVSAGWVNILGVRPQFRRRGLARAMLADGIEWILGRGMDSIYIGVISENEKALELYKSLGFEKEHEGIWFRRPVVLADANP
ncbi:MAG: hypothetical protein A3K60_08680 [Euryarchaeota archaeon RBG_19FT_COMBO_56_21]|nr:MAG: hypothetical protein A3K60_08680 [Euryarchaeota archaeon RBG_19FT_COMBO_56_21]